MKISTRLVSLVTAAIMLTFSLSACNTNDPSSTTTPDNTTPDVTPAVTTPEETTTEAPAVTTPAPDPYEKQSYDLGEVAEQIKITGRSKIVGDGILVNWSASGIEFNADCKGDVILRIQGNGTAKYSVFVDGEHTSDIYMGNVAMNYTIAKNLPEGVHNFRLVKLTDPETVEKFVLLTVNGTLNTRPADKELYIEFLGDSVTCGYGLGTKQSGSYDNDATKSWAYLVAQELNCDYSLVCVGGIGVVASTADRHGTLVMNDLYPNNFCKDSSKAYEPERKPDYVVVGLNTNDLYRVNASMKDQYCEKANALLDSIKRIYGDDIKIIWMSGLMDNPGLPDTWISEILNSRGGAKTGYAYTTGIKNMSGINNHPTAEGQKANAEKFVKYFKILQSIYK